MKVISFTLKPIEMDILSILAKIDGKPIDELVIQLIREVLELREDMILSAIATERDIDDIETISHQEAWK